MWRLGPCKFLTGVCVTRKTICVHICSCIDLASKWRHKVPPLLTHFLLIIGRKICLLKAELVAHAGTTGITQ